MPESRRATRTTKVLAEAAALLLLSSSWTRVTLVDASDVGEEDDVADDDWVRLELLQDEDDKNGGPCGNGSCPFSWDEVAQPACGIWLGPSPIKQKEEHGFGFGMFTGRHIRNGTTLESLYMGTSDDENGDDDVDADSVGEVILPLFGSRSLDAGAHPPIREYVWAEDNMPEIAIEYPDTLTFHFMPAAAAILPCTNQNYNVDLIGDGKYSSGGDRNSVQVDTNLHRSRDAAAGAFAQRNSAQYVAVRDIAPGEELVCRCSEDDFDGGEKDDSACDASK